jgi:hypothetical protein
MGTALSTRVRGAFDVVADEVATKLEAVIESVAV